MAVTTRRASIWILAGFAATMSMLGEPSLRAAVTSGLPSNVCFDDRCGPRQAAVWDRFLNGRGLNAATVGKLHAGRCFAFGRHLNPDRAHWGGFLIDSDGGEVWFDGRFSFFEPLPDYLSWSVGEARRKWPGRRSMELRDDYAYANFDESWIPVRYWFRRAPASTDLLLVSYFGFEMTLLCDLKRLD